RGIADLKRQSGARAVRKHPVAGNDLRHHGALRRLALSQWRRIPTALIAASSVLIGGFAGYADWTWWVGPAIGLIVGTLNSLPTLTDPFERLSGRLTGFAVNVAVFGGMPYGMYALVRALAE